MVYISPFGIFKVTKKTVSHKMPKIKTHVATNKNISFESIINQNLNYYGFCYKDEIRKL